MKTQIKSLLKTRKIADSNKYPGYGYEPLVIIDFNNNKTWYDFNGKLKYNVDFTKMLKDFCITLPYHTLMCGNAQKGSFVNNSYLPEIENIMNFEYNDFYIDNEQLVKMYFVLNKLYLKYKNTDTFAFVMYSYESGILECKVFNTQAEIDKYIQEYWLG